MRIIHIGNVNKEANGVGTVIKSLSKEQRRLGHEVMTLTASRKEESLESFEEVQDVEKFEKILDGFLPDIIVFHSLFIWEYVKFYKILKKRNIPYLLQAHGALSKENYKKNKFKKWVALTLFFKKFIKGAEDIIYLNQTEYNNSELRRINQKWMIIPNGVETPIDITEIESKKSDKNNDKVSILYLGRIAIKHKGLDILVSAIKKISESKYADKIQFIFYGTGTEEDMKIFKGLLESVNSIASFKGPVYGKEKGFVYKNCDYFILTSRFEGMPMGVLEALSFGKPCIVTDGTNMADVIHGNSCGYVADLDENSIADAIISAFEERDRNYKFMSMNSVEAAKRFDWKKIANQTLDLYRNVIANG